MPKWLDKKDEKRWEKAKAIVEHTKDKSESKFKDRDWGLVMHIMKNMRPKKKKKKKSSELPLSIKKEAISIVIAPFEPIIQKAAEAIEKIQPGYFSSIKKIVVEQSPEAGDPFHYGKVKSSEPDTIYVSMSAVRSAVSSAQGEEEVIRAVAGILAHEMGHLKAKLQGGEGPAESEEHRILDMLSNASMTEISELIKIANELDEAGWHKEASIIDIKINNKIGINKVAFANPYINPDDVADTIIRIIYHFAQKVKVDSQTNYLRNFADKLRKIDDIALSTRKKNPGAGLGASISIIKNLLAGHNRIEISQILSRVLAGISKI